MEWNAFTLVDPVMKKTKSLLFSFNLRYWIKLAFVSMLSIYGSKGGGGGGGNNLNLSTDSLSSIGTNSTTTGITGKAVSKLSESSVIGGLIGILSLLFLGLVLFSNYITSVFSLVYLDALSKKNYFIKNSLKSNHSKGISLFWFRILIGLLSIGVIALIVAYPLINIFKQGGFVAYGQANSILGIVFDLLPFLILLGLWIISLGIFKMFAFDFGLPALFQKSITMRQAVKETYKNLNNQKVEGLIYLLAKIVFGLLVGIIGVLIFFITLLVALIIGAIIGLIMYFILAMISQTFAIVVLVIVGFVYFIAFIFTFVVLMLPFSTFMSYFSLLSYEKMFKTTIVKIK